MIARFPLCPFRSSRRVALAWLCASGCFAPAVSQAADPAPAAWLTRPVRLIVGYAAGSSPDLQARLLSGPLSRALGQPVVVENKPGASGNIGADTVAKATDGHTIGVIGNGPLTSSQFLYGKLPYNPLKDFAPLAMIGSAPLIWVAKASSAANTEAYFKQLRAAGANANFGSVGTGSGGHLGAELVKDAMGMQMVHVPYNGGPAVINALIGGEVQMALLPASTVMPLVQASKLAAVAVSTTERSPLAPGVSSMREIGAGSINIEVWNAVMAPASMPKAHQDLLAKALASVLQSPEVRQKLLAQGWSVPDDIGPAALSQRIQSDSRLYGDLIAKKRIHLE